MVFDSLHIFLKNIFSLQLSDWPTEKMAKILTITCLDSKDCSEKRFLDILNKCVETEIETENLMDSIGSTTPFRRSTAYSKKLAKDFMISMRMKKVFKRLPMIRKLHLNQKLV